jgi:hypothetical protein
LKGIAQSWPSNYTFSRHTMLCIAHARAMSPRISPWQRRKFSSYHLRDHFFNLLFILTTRAAQPIIQLHWIKFQEGLLQPDKNCGDFLRSLFAYFHTIWKGIAQSWPSNYTFSRHMMLCVAHARAMSPRISPWQRRKFSSHHLRCPWAKNFTEPQESARVGHDSMWSLFLLVWNAKWSQLPQLLDLHASHNLLWYPLLVFVEKL